MSISALVIDLVFAAVVGLIAWLIANALPFTKAYANVIALVLFLLVLLVGFTNGGILLHQ